MTSCFPPAPQKNFFLGFAGLSALLGLLMPFLSQHYAITYDEWMDTNYGYLILKYILSGGENTSYTSFWHGYLYSGFFFVLTGTLSGFIFHTIPYFMNDVLCQTDHFFPFFQLSHLVNSVFGFYLFFFTGLCAKEIKGWRAACLAFVLIAVSPRIFGYSMNNPKDIPFATAYILATYLMVRFFKQMPRPSWSLTSFLAAAIGISIGCRVGGVILIVFLFFFGLIFFVLRRLWQHEPMPFFPWLSRLIIVALNGYLVGLIFWPYGQWNPFLNIFQALARLSDFRFSEGKILFQGQFHSITALPWSYVPIWIFISTPCVVIIGWLLFCVFLPIWRKDAQKKNLIFIAVTALFPIGFIILKHSVLYNDWRHLYFTYGPLVVLAAVGWDHLLSMAKSSKAVTGAYAFFLFLTALPIFWMVRNHPHQVLYFNEIEGGLRNAAGNYEIDYWGSTLRTAAERLGHYHLLHFPDHPATVRSDGCIMSTYPVLRKILGSRYFPYLYPDRHVFSPAFRYMNIHYSAETPLSGDWDYGITLLQQQSQKDIGSGKWLPKNVLFEIKVDGTTVCAVTQNPLSPLFQNEKK